MSNNYYEFKENIGQGQYGQVYKAINRKENKYYAIKRLNFKDITEKEKKSIDNEVRLLKELKHPNIISYKDSFVDKDNYFNIVTLFCEGGDMYNKILKQNGEYFSEEKIIFWMVQILLGLSYVHDKKIIHRDIKSQNIFIQNSHIICIGDFGIAKIINQTQTQTMGASILGTPLYMSPESFNDPKSNSFKSDIWSTGCCLYELCNLKHAFGADTWEGVFVKVIKGQKFPLNPKYSQDLRNIIDSMLNVKPKNRPTISQIIETPFIRPHVANYINDFYKNYESYNGTLEQALLLKEQADKFGIFKFPLNKEIIDEQNERKEIERKRLTEDRKKVAQRLYELEKMKIKKNSKKFANNQQNKEEFNQINSERDEKKKINSLDKNNQKFSNKNDYLINGKKYNNRAPSNDNGTDSKYSRHNGNYMSNDNNKKNNLKSNISPLNNYNEIKENPGSSNNKRKTNKRPLTSKKGVKSAHKDQANNISLIKEKEKLNRNDIDKKEDNRNVIQIRKGSDFNENQNINNINNNIIKINNKGNENYNNIGSDSGNKLEDNNENMTNKEMILNERINFFKGKCVNFLGPTIFSKAYNHLRKIKQNKNVEVNNSNIRQELSDMFGKSNIGYWQLIDQIIFLEDLLNKQ